MVARVVDLRKGKAETRRIVFPTPQQRGSREKRVSPLRVRRRRLRSALFFAFVCIVGVVGYGIHVLSQLPSLSISDIEVSGVEKIAPEEVASSINAHLDQGGFHYISRRNIFAYPKEEIEARIVAEFPRVRFASVSRPSLLSRTLHVAIGERHAYALWCTEESAEVQKSCFALDDAGFIFAPSATTTHGEFETSHVFSGGVPVDGGAIGKSFAAGQFPSLLALLRILQQETNVVPSRIAVLPEQDFTVDLEQGFFIKASFGQDPEMLARNLELVLSSEALRERIQDVEYIDLRFGNRVYYKLKGEEQTNI